MLLLLEAGLLDQALRLLKVPSGCGKRITETVERLDESYHHQDRLGDFADQFLLQLFFSRSDLYRA